MIDEINVRNHTQLLKRQQSASLTKTSTISWKVFQFHVCVYTKQQFIMLFLESQLEKYETHRPTLLDLKQRFPKIQGILEVKQAH